MRHPDPWRNDIDQTVRPHLRGRPFNGLFERGRAAQPVPDPVAKKRQLLHAALIGQRGVNQPVGHFPILFRQASPVLGKQRKCQGSGGEFRQRTSSHTRQDSSEWREDSLTIQPQTGAGSA